MDFFQISRPRTLNPQEKNVSKKNLGYIIEPRKTLHNIFCLFSAGLHFFRQGNDLVYILFHSTSIRQNIYKEIIFFRVRILRVQAFIIRFTGYRGNLSNVKSFPLRAETISTYNPT